MLVNRRRFLATVAATAAATQTGCIRVDAMGDGAAQPAPGLAMALPDEDLFSYLSRTGGFDLGRYRADERPVPSEVFPTPGLVTLRCDIHEHMRGLILVLDTPCFTLTDAQGRFRLEGVPPGPRVLKAWLSSTLTRQAPVDVPAGGAVEVDLP